MRRVYLALMSLASLAGCAFQYDHTEDKQQTTVSSGVTALWILANISYAGMRAQNHPSALWRILAFLFGFPGTLVTFLVVTEGSSRAYGITLPRVPGQNEKPPE
jgi:uncharacterized protein YceK